jgi:GAF domain-containing protein
MQAYVGVEGGGSAVLGAAGRVDRSPLAVLEIGHLRAQVRDLATRAEQLQTTALALSKAVTLRQVAEIAVSYATAELVASAGGAWLTSKDGGSADFVLGVGYDADQAALVAHLPMDGTVRHPVVDVLGRGDAAWLESPSAVEAKYPDLAVGPDARPVRALACLPLMVDARCMGALVFTFHERRSFTADDRRFLRTLAPHCAQAMARACLLADQQRMRADTEEALRRLRALEAVRELAEAGTPTEAIACAVATGASALRARTAGLWRTREDGAALELVESRGFDPGVRGQCVPLQPFAPYPLVQCAVQAGPVFSGFDPPLEAPCAYVPVLQDGHCRGVLAFTLSPGHTVSDDDLAFLCVLAHLCGDAMRMPPLPRPAVTREALAS